MSQTRSGRSTENFIQSLGSSGPLPPLSSLEAALPPPPQSAPQYTSLQTSCTTSQQASKVDPSKPLSSPLTSDMDIDPDSSVKFLIGTLVHHLQQITQSLQEPRTIIWYNELRGANAPIFIGAPDPVAAENWIKVMEKLYRAMEVPHDKWVKLAVPFLLGKAGMWYETIEALYGQIHDWATFKDHFYKNYFPMPVRNQKIKEFVNLKQGSMTVLEYAHKFFELGKFVPDVMEDELLKIGKFEEGFNFVIKSGLSGQRANDFSDLLDKAIRAENIGNIFSQTTAGVKKTIESDEIGTVTVTAPVNNKKPAVTTLITPECQKCNKRHPGECKLWSRKCRRCGELAHAHNSCPKCGKKQTSMQDRVCSQCGQMGHFPNSCPNRDPNATSLDAPRRGKRKCPGRDVTWAAGSEEVNETKPTGNIFIDTLHASLRELISDAVYFEGSGSIANIIKSPETGMENVTDIDSPSGVDEEPPLDVEVMEQGEIDSLQALDDDKSGMGCSITADEIGGSSGVLNDTSEQPVVHHTKGKSEGIDETREETALHVDKSSTSAAAVTESSISRQVEPSSTNGDDEDGKQVSPSNTDTIINLGQRARERASLRLGGRFPSLTGRGRGRTHRGKNWRGGARGQDPSKQG